MADKGPEEDARESFRELMGFLRSLLRPLLALTLLVLAVAAILLLR